MLHTLKPIKMTNLLLSFIINFIKGREIIVLEKVDKLTYLGCNINDNPFNDEKMMNKIRVSSFYKNEDLV